MQSRSLFSALGLALGATFSPAQELDRSILPITEPEHQPITTLDARRAPPRPASK